MRSVEGEPPALRAGLESYAVAVLSSEEFDRPPAVEGAVCAPPCEAVEIMHDGPTPIALLGRRRRAEKRGAERNVIRGGQFRDAAGAHRVAQTGSSLPAARNGPERPGNARKKQEQHERQRRRQQERAAREQYGAAVVKPTSD